MLDEQQQAAPEAVADDDAIDVAETVDAGGDDALDLGEMGAAVQTADEPAVSAEELQEIADAPERWSDGVIADDAPQQVSEERTQHAVASAEAAAAGDAGGSGGSTVAD